MKILTKILIGIIVLIIGYLFFTYNPFEQNKEIGQLQETTHEESLPVLEMGQILEFRTGSTNRQRYWAKQIIELQTAGDIKTPEIAKQMLLTADVVFTSQGGITNKQIRDLLKKIAPFIGASMVSAEQAARLIEIGGILNISASEDAYDKFLSEMYDNFRKSKAKTFGEYIEGYGSRWM